jgi:hypothetical protein
MKFPMKLSKNSCNTLSSWAVALAHKNTAGTQEHHWHTRTPLAHKNTTGTQEHHWHTRTALAPPQQAAAATSQHATCMQPMRWSGSVSTTSCFSFLRTLFDSLRGECQSRHHALQSWSRQSSTQQSTQPHMLSLVQSSASRSDNTMPTMATSRLWGERVGNNKRDGCRVNKAQGGEGVSHEHGAPDRRARQHHKQDMHKVLHFFSE